jgi:peptidoglycan/LPS O-acetylase OafA/YrhL
MGQEPKSNTRRQSVWGTTSLVIFLAAAAYFLFTEHRAHLWIALPLLAVCLAMIVVLWRAAEGDRHNKDASSPNYGNKKGELQ